MRRGAGKSRASYLLASASILACTCFSEAAGQVAFGADTKRAVLDENGVNAATGRVYIPITDLSIGTGDKVLSLTRLADARGDTTLTNQYVASLVVDYDSMTIQVALFDRVKVFSLQSGAGGWVAVNPDATGETLDVNNNIYTDSSGTKYYFDYYTGSPDTNDQVAWGTRIVRPDGYTIIMSWSYGAQLVGGGDDVSYEVQYPRIDWIKDSASNFIKLRYYSDDYYSNATYQVITGAVAVNTAVQPCDTTNNYCNNVGGGWPSVSYTFTGAASSFAQTVQSGGSVTANRSDGTASTIGWSYGQAPGYLSSISYMGEGRSMAASSTAPNYNGYWGFDITVNGVSSHYEYAPGSVVVTGPTSASRSYTVANGNVTTVTQAGATSVYGYDASNRLTSTTSPAGQETEYHYDGRGNILSTTFKARANSGLADIVTTADYDAICTNPAKCNKPNWTRDAAGRQTDYQYDLNHGGPIEIALPAPDGGAARPRTRYGYQAQGTSTGQVIVPVSIAQCRTQAACANSADEMVETMTYNGQLALESVTRRSGDHGVVQVEGRAYDRIGNLIAIDGSEQGSADTIRMTYDEARRLTGVIQPDPDGGGPRRSVAIRQSYDQQGRRTSLEQGSVPGGGTDLSGFAAAETLQTGYDVNGRRERDTIIFGGGTQSVVQYSYDAAGRLECTALRLNPAAFGSLPSACGVGPIGQAGADRITRNEYEPAGRMSTVTKAYGTPDAATEETGYTATGQVAWVSDGKGNRTAFAYDGHDRTWRTCFLTASSADCANGSADYEQVTLDQAGQVTSRRLRDGQVIGYGHDALDRTTSITRPGGVYWQVNHSYGYDLQSNLIAASDSNGRTLTFGYDALSRRITQGDNWYGAGNASYQYDASDRRTRATWSDGFFVTYQYDHAGELAIIRENGGLALASFGYDDLGRRTSVTRGNGTTTGYTYDAGSRLQSLSHDLAGGAQDLQVGFTYNPAGQIASRTSSNDAYAWAGGVAIDRTYGSNALNQYTSAGSVGFGYDGRGNLTQSGGSTYGYTVDNKLATAPGANLAYDPMGRLFNGTPLTNGGPNTTFVFDGDDVLAEINNDNQALLRRYVHGDGTDDPLVWYEGGQRRYLHADERGSVIAVSDDGGNALAINTYDEFGIPGPGNQGRYQYTGQKWLPNVGLYDYKARTYSPTLGRFMQTDPIGYGDGLNWYDYVGGDPINDTDPSGLCRPPGPDEAAVVCANRYYQWHGRSYGVYAYNQRNVDLERQAAYLRSRPNPHLRSKNAPLHDVRDKWVLEDGRFVPNPAYEVPWWDYGLGGAIIIPPVIGAAAATIPASGPAGLLFGRLRYRNGAPSLFNGGRFRVGWSWNSRGWAGSRNYFGVHGGRPGTAGHWHVTPVPGPKGPGW